MALPSLTMRMYILAALLVPGLSVSADSPSEVRVVCCDVDGKQTCGDPAPPQCLTRAKTVIRKGITKKEEAPLTTEQIAARELAVMRKKEEERKAAEQARKDRALLESYSSAKDIDAARERFTADIEKSAEQAKNRLETALAKKEKLDAEREFYLNQPTPVPLKRQIDDNVAEIVAQRKVLGQKDADMAAAKQRFDADKQRFLQLGGKP